MIDFTSEDNADLMLMEPREQFDPCIVGVVERFHDRFVLYSRKKVLASLVEEATGATDDEDYDPATEALEHYEFNIIGGWVGEHTPAFLIDDEEGPDEPTHTTA